MLLEQAGKYQVCPFEMSLDVASWVDDIICDYNYVFDPNVYLKRFLQRGSGEIIYSLWMRLIIWWNAAGRCTVQRFTRKIFGSKEDREALSAGAGAAV